MHYTPPAPTAGLSLLLLMHFTAGRGNGAQASIGGAIGLAGRAVRRLWALNSKGAFASALYRQAADYGPSIGFQNCGSYYLIIQNFSITFDTIVQFYWSIH